MCDQIILLNYSIWPTSESLNEAIKVCLYSLLEVLYPFYSWSTQKLKIHIMKSDKVHVHITWKMRLFKHIFTTKTPDKLNTFLHIYPWMSYFNDRNDILSSAQAADSSHLNLFKCLFTHTWINSWFFHLMV